MAETTNDLIVKAKLDQKSIDEGLKRLEKRLINFNRQFDEIKPFIGDKALKKVKQFENESLKAFKKVQMAMLSLKDAGSTTDLKAEYIDLIKVINKLESSMLGGKNRIQQAQKANATILKDTEAYRKKELELLKNSIIERSKANQQIAKETEKTEKYIQNMKNNSFKQQKKYLEDYEKSVERAIKKQQNLLINAQKSIQKAETGGFASKESISDFKEQANSIGSYEKRLKGLQDQYKRTGTVSVEELMSIERGLDNATMAVKRHELAVSKVDKAQHFKTIATRALEYSTIFGGIFAVTQSLRAATAFVMEFDTASRTLSAVLDLNLEKARDLEKGVVSLGVAYGGTLKELNQVITSLGRAGLATEDLLVSTSVVQKLALLTGDTIAQSSDALISFSTVFKETGLSVEELGDKLAFVANASRLSTQDINTFASYALSAAKSTGLTIDAVNGLAVAFSNAGVNASTIGTQIRKVTDIFKKDTPEIKALFQKLGLSQQSFLLQLQEGQSDKAFQTFIRRIQGLTTAEFNTLTGGLEILTRDALNKIRNNSTEIIKAINQSISESSGELNKASVIVEGYQKTWERLVNYFNSKVMPSFDGIIGGLSSLGKAFLRANGQIDSEVESLVLKITDLGNSIDIFSKIDPESNFVKRLKNEKSALEDTLVNTVAYKKAMDELSTALSEVNKQNLKLAKERKSIQDKEGAELSKKRIEELKVLQAESRSQLKILDELQKKLRAKDYESLAIAIKNIIETSENKQLIGFATQLLNIKDISKVVGKDIDLLKEKVAELNVVVEVGSSINIFDAKDKEFIDSYIKTLTELDKQGALTLDTLNRFTEEGFSRLSETNIATVTAQANKLLEDLLTDTKIKLPNDFGKKLIDSINTDLKTTQANILALELEVKGTEGAKFALPLLKDIRDIVTAKITSENDLNAFIDKITKANLDEVKGKIEQIRNTITSMETRELSSSELIDSYLSLEKQLPKLEQAVKLEKDTTKYRQKQLDLGNAQLKLAQLRLNIINATNAEEKEAEELAKKRLDAEGQYTQMFQTNYQRELATAQKFADEYNELFPDKKQLTADAILEIKNETEFRNGIISAVQSGISAGLAKGDFSGLVSGLGGVLSQYASNKASNFLGGDLLGALGGGIVGGLVSYGASKVGDNLFGGGGGKSSSQIAEERLTEILREIENQTKVIKLQGFSGKAQTEELRLLTEAVKKAEQELKGSVSFDPYGGIVQGTTRSREELESIVASGGYSSLNASEKTLILAIDKLNTKVLESTQTFISAGLSLEGINNSLNEVTFSTFRVSKAMERLGITTSDELKEFSKIAVVAGEAMREPSVNLGNLNEYLRENSDLTQEQIAKAPKVLQNAVDYSDEINVLNSYFQDGAQKLKEYNSLIQDDLEQQINDQIALVQGFKDLRESITSTTDSILENKISWAEVIDSVNAFNDLDGGNKALANINRYFSEQSALIQQDADLRRDEIKSKIDLLEAEDDVLRSFKDYADDLRLSSLEDRFQTTALQSRFLNSLQDVQNAINTGDPDVGTLGQRSLDLAGRYITSLETTAGSRTQFLAEQARVAGLLSGFQGSGEVATIDDLNISVKSLEDVTEKKLEELRKQTILALDSLDENVLTQIGVAENQITAITDLGVKYLGSDSPLVQAIKALPSDLSELLSVSGFLQKQDTAQAKVANTYQSTLGRAPDTAGSNYWSEKVSSGAIPEKILGQSVTLGAVYSGESSLSSAIDTIYQKGLGKSAEPEAKAWLTGLVESGKIKVNQIADVVAAGAKKDVANGVAGAKLYKQFMEGGFTGIGAIDEVAGIVHKGEYVAPASQVKMFPELFSELNSIRGFKTGGFTDKPVIQKSYSSNNEMSSIKKILEQMLEVQKNQEQRILSLQIDNSKMRKIAEREEIERLNA